MIELERHIEILLLSNDCVIVPELGGFMAHHVDARYDGNDGMFLPPLRTLGFNPQLKLNDSLLAQSYIEAYDISYPEAVRRIEDEVNELKQHLSNEGAYELNDIGTLYQNHQGNYTFEPCEAGILTPELYGLSAFEMEILDKPAIKGAPTPVLPIAEPEAKGHEDPKIVCIRESTLRKIAAVFIGILVVLSFTIPIGNNEPSNILKSNIDTGILYKVMPKNITTGKVPVKAADTLKAIITQKVEQENAKTTAEKAKEVEKATEDAAPFCIVLASKVSMRNAEEFVKKLHTNGYETARIHTRNKVNRVIYGSYQSESDAYQDLNRLNGNDDFAEGWIMKVN